MQSLYTKEVRSSFDSAPCIVILHGLLGEGANWQSIAQKLPERFHRVMVDIVNHGASFHSDTPTSYAMMAEHVRKLMQNHSLMQQSVILLGHSMGGKIAMRIALEYPSLIDALIVVDMFLQVYPPSHNRILEGMQKISAAEVASRSEAEVILKEYEPDKISRGFILKNLIKNADGHMHWKCNLSGIATSYSYIRSWEPIEAVSHHPCIQICGATSSYRQEEGEKRFYHHFPDAQLIEIEDAGHIVHFDQQQIFLSSVNQFLDQVYPG